MQASKNKLSELQAIITKMPLEVFSVTVLTEFGIRWREVSQAVRNARLPMTMNSVARVMCRHVAKSLTKDELDDILGRLRLKLVATQSRTWHVLRLEEPTTEEPVATMLRSLPHRVLQALRSGKRIGMRPEVQSAMIGDLMYLSIQFVSDTKDGSVLYMATPPGEAIALVSSLGSTKLLKACIEGLGYARYENANLYGKDIPSLLRMSDPSWNGHADHLTTLPPYAPIPTILSNGIDYTNKNYDEQYVDSIIGPNPPLLTDLNLTSSRSFFDKSRLNKKINLTVSIKSEDISKTLKGWVAQGAITPTSDFFQIFQEKSIKINIDSD